MASEGEDRRRPQWRGERQAVLVRMPIGLAADLRHSAQEAGQSISERAAELLAVALHSGEKV